MTYFSNSEKDTIQIAEKFSKSLKGGDVVAFKGGLGMGKTAFVRGIASGLMNSSHISSPTFAIVNDYGGQPHLYHFDMYRVYTWDDLYSTGFFDYLNENSILCIEWSENIEEVLPDNTIFVTIELGEGENCRIINIEGRDAF